MVVLLPALGEIALIAAGGDDRRLAHGEIAVEIVHVAVIGIVAAQTGGLRPVGPAHLVEHAVRQRIGNALLSRSIEHIRNADVLIIGGTSLTVYPAAGLIDYYRGTKLVLINKSATSRDSQADLVICGSVGEALAEAAGL